MADSIIQIFIRAKSEVDKVVKSINNQLKSTKATADDLGTTSVENLTDTIGEATAEAKKLGEEITNVASAKVNQSTNQVREFRRELIATARAAKRISKNLKEAGERIEEIGKASAKAGAIMGVPFIAAIAQFTRFEKVMARVEAITAGITEETFEAMVEKAKELGRTTEFTATQAAEGFKFLAQAGLDATQAIEALPTALQLATVGELDLGEAADIVTNVMSGLRLEVEDLTDVADTLAFVASNSNTNLRLLGVSLREAGPLAAAAGISLEQIAAAIGALGSNAIQGTKAGTGLKIMLISLLTPTRQGKKALADLNIEITDATGNLRDFVELLGEFKEANLTIAEAEALFGREGAAVALAAINSAELVKSLEEGAEAAKGFAESVQIKLLDTLAGDLVKFQSAVSGVAQIIGESLAPAVRSVLVTLTDLINAFSDFATENKEVTQAVIQFLAAVATFLTVFGTITLVFGKLLKGLGSLIGLGGKSAGTLAKNKAAAEGVATAATAASSGLAKFGNAIRFLVPRLLGWGSILFGIYEVFKLFVGEANAAEVATREFSNELAKVDLADPKLSVEQLTKFKDRFTEIKEELEEKIEIAIEIGDEEEVIDALKVKAVQFAEALTVINDRLEKQAKIAKETQEVQRQLANTVGETTDTVRGLYASLVEASTADFRRLIADLERVRDATRNAFLKERDYAAATRAEAQYTEDIIDLAEERAAQRIRFAEAQFVRLKQLLDDEIKDQLDNARQTRVLYKDLVTERIAAEEEVFKVLQANLDRQQKAQQRYADRVVAIDKLLARERTKQAEDIASIERTGVGELQRFYDDRSRADETLSKAKRELLEGDYEEGLRLAKLSANISKQLNREVLSEQGRVLISQRSAQRTSLDRLRAAQKVINQALEEEREEAVKAGEAQKRRAQETIDALNTLSEEISKLRDVKISIDADLTLTDIEAEIDRLSGAVARKEFSIKVASGDLEAVNTTLDEVDRRAGIPKLIRTKIDEESFRETQSKLAEIPEEKQIRISYTPGQTEFTQADVVRGLRVIQDEIETTNEVARTGATVKYSVDSSEITETQNTIRGLREQEVKVTYNRGNAQDVLNDLTDIQDKQREIREEVQVAQTVTFLSDDAQIDATIAKIEGLEGKEVLITFEAKGEAFDAAQAVRDIDLLNTQFELLKEAVREPEDIELKPDAAEYQRTVNEITQEREAKIQIVPQIAARFIEQQVQGIGLAIDNVKEKVEEPIPVYFEPFTRPVQLALESLPDDITITVDFDVQRSVLDQTDVVKEGCFERVETRINELDAEIDKERVVVIDVDDEAVGEAINDLPTELPIPVKLVKAEGTADEDYFLQIQDQLADIDTEVNKERLIVFNVNDEAVTVALANIPEELTVKVNFVSEGVPTLGGDVGVEGGLASGGPVRGKGTGTSDSILSWLSNGEFVMRAAAVKKYGMGFMSMLNNMRLPDVKNLTSTIIANIDPRKVRLSNNLPAFAMGGPVVTNFESTGYRPNKTPIVLYLDGQSYEMEAEDTTVQRLQSEVNIAALKKGRQI